MDCEVFQTQKESTISFEYLYVGMEKFIKKLYYFLHLIKAFYLMFLFRIERLESYFLCLNVKYV